MVNILPERKQRFIQAYHTHTAPPFLCLSIADCKALAIEHTVTLSRTGSLSSLTLNTLTRTFKHTQSDTHTHTDTRTNSQAHTVNIYRHTHTQIHAQTVNFTHTHRQTHAQSVKHAGTCTQSPFFLLQPHSNSLE